MHMPFKLKELFRKKPKYELLTDPAHTIKDGSTTLLQIRALRDFGNVKAGDLGGFIGSEKNLSQEGTCWVGLNTGYYGDYSLSGDTQYSGGGITRGHKGAGHEGSGCSWKISPFPHPV
jgi:hypothetical protein